MPLRLAKACDIGAVATIYAAAFWDERAMGQIMHPYRKAHPEDFLRYWRQKVTEWYWDYGHQIIVAYTIRPTSNGKDEEEILTGVADWIRHGEGWESLWGVWGSWDVRTFITRVVGIRNSVSCLVHHNRAADPALLNMGALIWPIISHFWSGSRRTGWYLNFLAVHPIYQNQGYGSSLAQWGIERSKKEHIAASVISGEHRDHFYRRCGFDTVVGNSTEGEGNPLKNETVGGTVMFRDPKSE